MEFEGNLGDVGRRRSGASHKKVVNTTFFRLNEI